MRVDKIPFKKTAGFSRLFLDYIDSRSQLAHTHSFEPSVAGFEKALSYRKLSEENRETLVNVLTQQYEGLKITEVVGQNIKLLKEKNTFTVTTGHQLNIFTGPLFFIYKIVSVINICKKLAQEFPEYKFIPVYWMASEDHDFEEINHAFIDNEKYVWETSQSGAVGHFHLEELAKLSNKIPGRSDVFINAYNNSSNLADAVRHYVNELFGEYGLVVVDANNKDLKAEFKSYIKDDLTLHTAYHKVNSRSKFLEKQGYKPQLNAREINLFYLDENIRSRIEKKDDRYYLADMEISFSESEILDLVEKHPERFSPNVILRPLYQEVILPNLGYVGGPAEVAYWLQFKEMFDFFRIDYPVLMPRSFGLYLGKNAQRKKEKLNLLFEDLFTQADVLKKKYVHTKNGRLDLAEERKKVVKVYNSIRSLAEDIDPTLDSHILAKFQKHQECLDEIEAKLVKAEKRNRDDEMNMITYLNEYVYPSGTLQERRVNYLSIHDDEFIPKLITNTDPFDLRMHIYMEY
ncbi:MAG: bacillithiol biosynthesis cysteine-adding enzyme BshC [Bacteroidota bacterium]